MIHEVRIHAIPMHTIQTVEVALESIEVSVPEPAKLCEPVIHLAKWFGFQPVETALCIHRGFNEASLPQNPQVLGHGRLRHAELPLDLSHRLF